MLIPYRFTEYPSLIIIQHFSTALHSAVYSSLPLEMPDQFVFAIKDLHFFQSLEPHANICTRFLPVISKAKMRRQQ